MDIGGNMKKILYFTVFIVLLYLISTIPVSAKEIRTCLRTENDLRVREQFINKNNHYDILNTPCVDEVQKVYDFADLLTDEEEDKLYNEALNFIEATNYDIAIVTTNNNTKKNEVAYADDFYDYNYFGKNETRDGILLLIDMTNRQVYISTTGNAILMYYSRIDSIIDAGYTDLKNEKYYDTFSKMTSKMIDYFRLGVDKEDAKEIFIDRYGKPSYIKYISYPMVGFISGIITLITSIIIYNTSKLKIKVGSTISYLKDYKIKRKEDNFVNTIVTHTLRYNDTSSSGGHSSGGGSFHSSSSGSFHGGGGRGF